jgi:DNA-binding ferritin-like protein
MADKVEDQAYLVFVDRHIEELEERINALRERMVTMGLQSYETQNQQALLSSMLQVREDMEKFRAELVEAFNAKYSDA